MGELESIKALPGMIDAAADTLHKAWRAGIDLAMRAADHPRLAAIARLEAAVLDQLPSGMMRPLDIVAAATARIAHAPRSLARWRSSALPNSRRAGGRCSRPSPPISPCSGPPARGAFPHGWTARRHDRAHRRKRRRISAVSAATAYHEAIEAMRWARSLLASGVSPSEIAIATASPADYDDHFLALRADANIDLHFVHGVRTVTTREGQAAAALADIVVRGLSQSRLRRLAALCRDSGPFRLARRLAAGPADRCAARRRRLEPPAGPVGAGRLARWRRPCSGAARRDAGKGPDAASEIGEAFLKGRALAIWRKALLAGPAASVDATLETLKQDDGLEACVCVAWMPASALAASPRRFVRLLGLNSSRWPRGIAEDRLIPDHIIPTPVLDPLPVNLADRRDFETILATTAIPSFSRAPGATAMGASWDAAPARRTWRRNLSAPQRDAGARLQRDRPPHGPAPGVRRRSTSDERAGLLARLAAGGDHPHDGLVRADHPLVLAILGRTQSASSLRRLLRNPLSFVWVYAFGWREPQSSAEPLVLDALGIGDLVHMVLDRALRDLEAAGGLAAPTLNHRSGGGAGGKPSPPTGRASVRFRRPSSGGAPSTMPACWQAAPCPMAMMSCPARAPMARCPSAARSRNPTRTPWDVSTPVTIPDTGFNIAGYIDRLDISGDGKRASCATTRRAGRRAATSA
jgi:hypothetical protein